NQINENKICLFLRRRLIPGFGWIDCAAVRAAPILASKIFTEFGQGNFPILEPSLGFLRRDQVMFVTKRNRRRIEHGIVQFQFPFVRQTIALSHAQEIFPQWIEFATHERAIDYFFGGESALAARKNHSILSRDWLADWHRSERSRSKNWAASVLNPTGVVGFPTIISQLVVSDSRVTVSNLGQ